MMLKDVGRPRCCCLLLLLHVMRFCINVFINCSHIVGVGGGTW